MKQLLLCLTLLLSALGASAERTVRLLYFQAPPDAPRKAFLYGSSGQYVDVRFPRWNLSDKVTLPDSGEQFILLPEPLAEDEPPPASAPRILIPLGMELTVLLIFPDANNPILPIRVQTINASASVFGPGELYWVNLTDIAVGGMIGERKLLMKPRSTQIMQAPKQENGDYPVLIDCATPGENKRRWLVRQTWRHNANARQLVFIQPLDAPRIASLHSVTFYD